VRNTLVHVLEGVQILPVIHIAQLSRAPENMGIAVGISLIIAALEPEITYIGVILPPGYR